jgi:hypothetical protein
MSAWRDMADRLGLRVPSYIAFACDYLESHGKRFCVDFGTDNAVTLAREHWRSRKLRKKTR